MRKGLTAFRLLKTSQFERLLLEEMTRKALMVRLVSGVSGSTMIVFASPATVICTCDVLVLGTPVFQFVS